MTKLDSAFYHSQDLGLPVFPLHGVWQDPNGILRCTCGKPDCERAGKHPATPNGLLDATRDADLIRKWWLNRPGNNIGLRTGDVVVLDIDPEHAGDRSLLKLEAQYGSLPRTWISQTGGGGWHAFFMQPDGPPVGCSIGKVGPGLDVKGERGYIVAPGSLHRSGRPYTWHAEQNPWSTPIAKMPAWLAELFHSTAGKVGKARSSAYWADVARTPIAEGGRNDALTQIAGHLMWTGKTCPHLVLALLLHFNRAQCSPPLTDAEVEKIVDSISGRELQRRGALR